MKFYDFWAGPKKNEKLEANISHTQNVSIGTGPMSNDVFFYRARRSLNHIQNELPDFLPKLFLHLIFILNCAAVFAANSRGGVLLDRVNPLLCKLSPGRGSQNPISVTEIGF